MPCDTFFRRIVGLHVGLRICLSVDQWNNRQRKREKERKNGSMGQWIKEVLIRQMSL